MAVNIAGCVQRPPASLPSAPTKPTFTEDLLCACLCAVARLFKIGFCGDRLIPNMFLVKKGHHPSFK